MINVLIGNKCLYPTKASIPSKTLYFWDDHLTEKINRKKSTKFSESRKECARSSIWSVIFARKIRSKLIDCKPFYHS